MIDFLVNGKRANIGDFEKLIMAQVKDTLVSHVREKIGTMRDPKTGEFPTILVLGDSVDNLRLKIEATPELISLIQTHLAANGEDLDQIDFLPRRKGAPKVFLSYASEDKELAWNIANQLQINGIDTWWDEWCMSAGDSIRQKIDSGLSDCSHFIVLLTPNSLNKRWVNEEIDAAFMLKMSQKVTFITIRCNLSINDLPPLLSGSVCPEINADDIDVEQLISDIHGLSRKPKLGVAPIAAHSENLNNSTGHSPAANVIIRHFVESTQHARKFDPHLGLDELQQATKLTDDDLTDALYELSSYIKSERNSAYPLGTLFSEFDQFWKSWNPAEDALKLATDIINDPNFPTSPEEIAIRYNWDTRRLNPAMSYLVSRQLAEGYSAMGGGDFAYFRLTRNDATRRFVKSRTL